MIILPIRFGTTHGLVLKKSSRRLFRARSQRFLDKLIYVQYTLLKLSNSTLLALMNFNYYIGMAHEGRSIGDMHDNAVSKLHVDDKRSHSSVQAGFIIGINFRKC